MYRISVIAVIALAAALLAAGCCPSTEDELTDAEAVWCESNSVDVADAAEVLEVVGSESIDPRIRWSMTEERPRLVWHDRESAATLTAFALHHPDSYTRACKAAYEVATITSK